jgi:hypothetical protein
MSLYLKQAETLHVETRDHLVFVCDVETPDGYAACWDQNNSSLPRFAKSTGNQG